MVKFDKCFSYFLGYLWADGFIERSRCVLEIVESDAMDIFNDINSINFLNICSMKRSRKNKKPQMSIYFCDVMFYDNFLSKYFLNKSVSSPCDLIEIIPNEYKRYFHQGIIDGDGCFYLSKNLKTKQFYITSSYGQNWKYIEILFRDLNITQYEIKKVISKNGNMSSYIRIKKYSELKNLYEYLYPNGYEIGLKRKFQKCKSIIDNPPKYNSNKSIIDPIELNKSILTNDCIVSISKIYNCNWRKIYEVCKKQNIEYPKGFFRNTYKKTGKS
jgi:hypothetical protein